MLPADASNQEEIERAFALMARERAQAVFITNDAYFPSRGRQIGELAAKGRLPSVSPYSELVEAGGLLSYGQNYRDNYRHAAVYVDKILKGAKPSELPIEQPTNIELVINRKTARELGLTIPKELLLRADKVVG